MEMGEAGAVPFYSGLLNGRGRHIKIPYSQTRLSVFTVEKNSRYRFRLIGSQGLFAYKFSIDGHKLTVVATDGYWIVPKKNVDFIIIHSGERYDFILDADQETMSYWMRGETLEINPKGPSRVYQLRRYQIEFSRNCVLRNKSLLSCELPISKLSSIVLHYLH